MPKSGWSTKCDRQGAESSSEAARDGWAKRVVHLVDEAGQINLKGNTNQESTGWLLQPIINKDKGQRTPLPETLTLINLPST